MKLALSCVSGPFDDGKLRRNGMLQNIKFFYDLLERMGYEPFLMTQDGSIQSNIRIQGAEYRSDSYDNVVRSGVEVPLVFEIGVTIVKEQREVLRRQNNSKIIVVKYGNALMFDIEFTVFDIKNDQKLNVGNADQVWISPHFKRQKGYLGSIFNCDVKVAPYLWEPEFLEHEFVDKSVAVKPDIFVMEPNINVCKTALIPLCIINELYCDSPNLFGRATIVNGQNINQKPYFINNVVANLPAVHAQAKKVYFSTRASFDEVFPRKNVLIGHHWENSLNYLYCEAIFKGVPLVHNSNDFAAVGYHYDDCDVHQGVEATRKAVLEIEKDHRDENREFLKNYSIKNDSVQATYKALIEDALSLN